MGSSGPAIMWNNTATPLAYLFTFRCRGTWLHGDERGSTDRFRNQYRTPHIPLNEKWLSYNTRALKQDPVALTEDQRRSVEQAVRETCKMRGWILEAMNVRTNHVHVVASIGEARPATALNALKANATRQMRQDGRWASPSSPWSDRGSKKYLWNERSVSRALDYVNNGQGGPPPEFDCD
jgi:REP element-mobilizing transposase RayT